MRTTPFSILVRSTALLLIVATVAWAALPTVKDHQKISDESGGLDENLSPGDQFGWAVEGIGDLDDDGVEDIVVGAPLDDEGGFNSGSLWVLFMNSAARVDSNRKINEDRGSFAGDIEPSDEFGTSVTSIGDLDDDGKVDLAVGAPRDDDGNENAGAVWILFLNDDGTVADEEKISDTEGDFDGQLVDGDLFGYAVASLGDLDGDDIGDLAVGAPLDDDGEDADKGAVWILFMRDDGTVRDFQKISDEAGDFEGSLSENDVFGNSVAALGDVDGDDVVDIAVGAPQDDDDDENSGAVWILFLNDDGRVKDEQKISLEQGGLPDVLSEDDLFGWAVAPLGDLNGDGIPDLGVGSPLDDDGGGEDLGAIYQIALNADGTVKELQKISASQGGFDGELDGADTFGTSLARAGDLDDDGAVDLVVGAPLQDDGGGIDNGSIWNLLMTPSAAAGDCGDATDDGIVNTTDALLTLRAGTQLETCELCRCDVNSSGTVTAPDAQRILTFAVGTEVELTCPACS